MDQIFGNFQGDSVLLQTIGRYGYKLYDDADLVLMYAHLLAAALFPIYIGSHASLKRPPGEVCKAVTKSSVNSTPGLEEDDDDDELDQENNVEGLTPSDAIMFPVLAGFTLAGLYFLIKWLEDPNILNRILGWYFSLIGVVGVGKLAADGLNVITTFIFPTIWSSGKDVFLIDPLLRQQLIVADSPFKTSFGGPSHRKFTDKTTPLPGFWSHLKFPKATGNFLWSTRALFTDRWILRVYVHGVTSIKSRIRLNDVTGIGIGIVAITVYNLYGKAWWLTNLMGFGFCYGTLQLMSPTTFWTGSLVLMGLFVYDVIMVFYTPMMVSVATTLDVPIKLVFPGPKRGGMLGLGDVVLPGIMMAIALRFDLYMFYLKKKRASSSAVVVPKPGTVQAAFHSAVKDNDTNAAPIYYSATGFQGERYWTTPSILALLPFPFSLLSPKANKDVPESIRGGQFPKTYFTASVIGYVVGMLVTLFVLNAYNHAQPALLYLVPGVLGSIWGTGLIRGEFTEMWNYTEDGGIFGDEASEDQKKKTAMDIKDMTPEALLQSQAEAAKTAQEFEKQTLEKKDKLQRAEQEHAHHVFLFSLSKPKPKAAFKFGEDSKKDD